MDITKTGARAARQRMKAGGRLPLASKAWKPGDRVLFIFPVDSVTEEGFPDFPAGERWGHELNLSKENDYKRGFVPTTLDGEIDSMGKPVGDDFLTRLASLSYAIRTGYKERKIEQETRDAPTPEALKAALKQLDESMKNVRPIVGGLRNKVALECFVALLDVNGNLKEGKLDFTHSIMNISSSKFDQLLGLTEKQGAFIEGSNYFYVEMETDAAKKKNEAGQADWKIPSKRLEELNPKFQEYVTKMVKDADITKESIESHFYDFQPYEPSEVKAAIAKEINANIYNLKKIDNATYHDHVKNDYVVTALQEVERVADANFIRGLINEGKVDGATMVQNLNTDMQSAGVEASAQTISVPTEQQQAQAQTLNIPTEQPQAQTLTMPNAPAVN